MLVEMLVDNNPEVDPDDEVFHDIEHPWDPEDIRVSTRNFSLRNTIDMIIEGGLDLAPDFQRLHVWRPVQKVQLIESVLLQIPLLHFISRRIPLVLCRSLMACSDSRRSMIS